MASSTPTSCFCGLCAISRVESERPEDCWLERWTHQAIQDGTRALDTLRDGVQEAIEILGRGFLAHKDNRGLQLSLREGTLDPQDYYRQRLFTASTTTIGTRSVMSWQAGSCFTIPLAGRSRRGRRGWCRPGQASRCCRRTRGIRFR